MCHSYHNIRSFIQNDTGHDCSCFHTIDIYFEERNRKMLPNEFIVYFRELCNCCYYSYCRFLRRLDFLFLSRSKQLRKMNVRESFTCPCLYKLTTKINVTDKTITKELFGQRFVYRVINWKYALYLDVFIANNSKCIVISCSTCLKSTLRACSLIPPKGDNACDK